MSKILLGLAMLLAAAPALATGGLLCRTKDRLIDVRLVVSHTAIPVVVSARLIDAGRAVPVALAQGWLDPAELRIDLVDRGARRHELRLRAKKSGPFYDGSLWRLGQRRWVRCREG